MNGWKESTTTILWIWSIHATKHMSNKQEDELNKQQKGEGELIDRG